MLELDFPADRIKKVAPSDSLIDSIGLKPIEVYKGKTDYLLIYDSQQEIESLKPNFNLLSASNSRGVIVSARGQDVDFVSRFFAPQARHRNPDRRRQKRPCHWLHMCQIPACRLRLTKRPNPPQTAMASEQSRR